MASRKRLAKRGFSRAPTSRPPRPRWRRWALPAGIVAVMAVGATAFLLTRPTADGAATAWAELGTADVHALAFDPQDPEHLFFGHHGGLLESLDGGRSWRPTALAGSDAMNVRAASGGLLQIAGHEVYLESRDGGQTWQPVPNDLPGLDLHAFVTAPSDASHAWAYAAGQGLFESTDAGRHWELRQGGSFGSLTVFEQAGEAVLVGLTQAGPARSDDGGRTWQPLATPAGQPVSVVAAANGSVLYAGTTSGFQRSTDGGASWSPTGFSGTAVAVAVAPGSADAVAVVDDGTRFYRSADGGATWPGPP
jgi:photosystem II stability/assembly factor-like uncharacterized protein